MSALVRNPLAEAAAVERAAELAEASALVPGVVRAAPLAARQKSATGGGQCTGSCAAGIAQGSRAAGGPHRKRPRRRAVSRTRRHGARRCRTAAMREPVRPAGACRPPGFRPRSRARRRRASPIDQHPHRVFPLTLRRGPATLYGVGRVFIQSRLPNSAWTSQISRTVDAFAGVSWHLAAVAGGGVSTGGAAGRRARRRRGGRPGCGPGR